MYPFPTASFEREFLMIVFGENNLVKNFDETFQEKLNHSMAYDFCHVSMTDESEEETTESLLTLTSSKYFTKKTWLVSPMKTTGTATVWNRRDTSGTDFTPLQHLRLQEVRKKRQRQHRSSQSCPLHNAGQRSARHPPNRRCLS